MFGRSTARATTFAAAFLLVVVGCSRDVHLAGRKIPHVTVGVVTIDGVTLDRETPPEDVAFFALRAIHDDGTATTPEAREAALARQFELCAADTIEKRNSTPFERDEFIYNVVYRWTPTVSHYLHDFPVDRDEARRRFVVRPVSERDRIDPEIDEVAVALEVAPPGGDRSARVVLMVWLAKDQGFWRVVHLGFDQQRRSLDGDSAKGSRSARIAP